jgi:RecB family exonuclease
MQAALRHMETVEDEAGEAAATGSAAHAGIAAYHTAASHKEGVEAGLAAIRDCLEKFPGADLKDAVRHLSDYVADTRNSTAEIIAVERRVRLILPPADGDPTGRDVVIDGVIDQVRRHEGQLMVFDVKTGGKPGWQMLHDYLFQISAYALAATTELGEPILPGVLLRTQGYRRRGINPADAPDGVYWPFNVTLDRARLYLEQIRDAVAQIRAGVVRFGPSLACSYCPFGGIWGCTAAAERHLA